MNVERWTLTYRWHISEPRLSRYLPLPRARWWSTSKYVYICGLTSSSRVLCVVFSSHHHGLAFTAFPRLSSMCTPALMMAWHIIARLSRRKSVFPINHVPHHLWASSRAFVILPPTFSSVAISRRLAIPRFTACSRFAVLFSSSRVYYRHVKSYD